MTANTKSKLGPPFKPVEERRVNRTMRLLPRHIAKIDSATKAELEELLEAWQPKTKKPAK